jgi:hypothetical protein
MRACSRTRSNALLLTPSSGVASGMGSSASSSTDATLLPGRTRSPAAYALLSGIPA